MTEILPVQDTAAPPTPPQTPPKKKYTKRADGVIIGPDGKPCRSCNSLTSFLSATTHNPTRAAATASTLAAAAAAASSPSTDSPPPDVAELGRASWTLLHSLAATYPPTASREEQAQMGTFMKIFARVYPCGWCAQDFSGWMERDENKVERYLGGRREFGDWLCRAHNDVNTKLGKGEFDCRKWMERWGGKEE